MKKLEYKKYYYGVSDNDNHTGLVFHFGRTVISLYYLKITKFRIKIKCRKFTNESFEIFEERYFTGNFLGLQLYKLVEK